MSERTLHDIRLGPGGDDGSFNAVCWAADGARLAVGGADGSVRVLTAEGRALWEGRHEAVVWSVSWSPDGRWLASGSRDGTVRLWEVGVAGRHVLQGHTEQVQSVGWSPDGRWLASGSQDRTVRLWEVGGAGRHDLQGHTNSVHSVSWSPDGQWLASGSDDRTARLWEVRGTGRHVLEGHTNTVGSVSWSPDGRWLASGSQDHMVRLWEVGGAGCQVLEGHTDTVWSVSWSPDGRWLASGSKDRAVRLWDAGGVARTVLEGHTGLVWSVSWSPDGARLASVADDGRLIIWSVEEARVAVASPWAARQAASVGRRAPVGASPWVPRLAEADGVCLGLIRGEGGVGTPGVAVSPDGRRLGTGSPDGRVRVWDLGTGAARELGKHEGQSDTVAWSPDGRWLASGAYDRTVRLWEVGGAGRAVLQGHTATVYSVSWSPDGRWLAAGSSDRTVRLWELGGVGRQLLEGHTAQVNTVSWSPDGRWLASGASDRTVRLWDPQTGQERARFNCPERFVQDLSWSPDGTFLVSGNDGDIVRIWDTRPYLSHHAATPAGPLPAALAALPRALAALHRLGLHPPLSLVADLLGMTAGQAPEHHPRLEALGELIQPLVNLRWPTAARTGLLPLLLGDGAATDPPPADWTAARIRDALSAALSGPAIPPRPPEVLVTPLLHAAKPRLTGPDGDRLLTLLHAVGPQAVIVDPGLPARLLKAVPQVPALSAVHRALLHLDARPSPDPGDALASGLGVLRAGIAPHGPLTALLPSQLALPADLMRYKHLRGGLLYRARGAAEPPRLRPMVILLDVSPPVFGPIEALTRPAAYAVASALLRAGLPAILVTMGGTGQVVPLEQPRDLLAILTERSLERAKPALGLRVAELMLNQLPAGPLPPAILLLTHAWFAAEAGPLSPPDDLRAIFVQYPHQRVDPPFAPRVWRSAELAHHDADGLGRALGEVLR